MQWNGLVRLSVFGGDLELDEVTRLMGISPTSTWRLGDRKGASLLKHESDGWQRCSEMTEADDPDAVLSGLLSLVSCSRSELDRTGRDIFVGVSFVFWLCAGAPPLELSPETIQALGRLGANLDVDLYVWGPETIPS